MNMIMLNMIGRCVLRIEMRRPQQIAYSFIIGKLFRKQASQQEQSQQQVKQPINKPQEYNDEDDDPNYNFFDRKQQIDMNFDFAKLKLANSSFFPEQLGKGGFQEVLYWSQNAKTPHQINQIVVAFNQSKIPKQINDKVHMNQFIESVISVASLAPNLEMLTQYGLFGFNFSIEDEHFWKAIERKALRTLPKESEMKLLIDIAFFISHSQQGEEIYNYVEQIFMMKELALDQIVKLIIIYCYLKKGKKQWIQKLFQNLAEQLHHANSEQITEVLPAIQQAKDVPSLLDSHIQKRVLQLINQFNLRQIFHISAYFGTSKGSQQLWQKLEVAAIPLVKKLNKYPIKTIQRLIYELMLSYKFSTNFIKEYLIKPLQKNNFEVLSELSARVLSAFAKGLYMYELQSETKQIGMKMQQLIISKITSGINEIDDWELIEVIKNYNITRDGSRELFIFFEEVISLKYIRQFVPDLDRKIIETLVTIYDNSGMCSQQMFESLKKLL